MAALSVPKSTASLHHNHLLFPDLEQVEPPPLSPPTALKHFQRGPMYSAYSDLRDRSIRMKAAAQSSWTPSPVPLKYSPLSSSTADRKSSRKENRKPSQMGTVLNFDSSKTPPLTLPLKLDLKRVAAASVGKAEEKKGRSGSRTTREMLPMRRSFSGFNQVKEISKVLPFRAAGEECRGGRGGIKAVPRKSFTGF